MKKYTKKDKLIILIRIITAALIAGILWIVIYFLAPVKASAAEVHTGFVMYDSTEFTRNVYSTRVEYSIDLTTSPVLNYSQPLYAYALYRVTGIGQAYVQASGNTTSQINITSGGAAYTYVEIPINFRLSTSYFAVNFKLNDVSTVDSLELYKVVISDTNDASVTNFINEQLTIINSIPYSDYLCYVSDFSFSDNTHYINTFAVNDAVVINTDIYTGDSDFFTLGGSLACTGGVSSYFASVTNGDVSTSVTIANAIDSNDRTAVSNFITSYDLNITSYLNNLNFHARFDLTPYLGSDIQISFGGYDMLSNARSVVFVINLHCYSYNGSGGDDTETETDVTDTETDIIIEDTVPYQAGYAAGYEAAAQLASNGVFAGGNLLVTYSYTSRFLPQGNFENHVTSVMLPLILKNNSLSLSNVTSYFDSKYVDTPYIDYTLTNVSIFYSFGSPFRYQRDLIYFTGFLLTDYTNYTKPQVILYDQDGVAHDTQLTIFSNRTSLNVNAYPEYAGLVRDIEINISFDASIRYWLDTYQMSIFVPSFDIVRDIAAYNKGLAVGKEDGEKLGFIYGKAEGEKIATDKAYSEGKADGFDEGKQAGIREEQSNEIRQNFKWYDMFFSMFDAQINTFRSIVNFEIFGVNVAGFVLGLVTIGIVAFIIRKVW